MNPSESGELGTGSSNAGAVEETGTAGAPPTKRRRGPYKGYLLCPTKTVPESTLRLTDKDINKSVDQTSNRTPCTPSVEGTMSSSTSHGEKDNETVDNIPLEDKDMYQDDTYPMRYGTDYPSDDEGRISCNEMSVQSKMQDELGNDYFTNQPHRESVLNPDDPDGTNNQYIQQDDLPETSHHSNEHIPESGDESRPAVSQKTIDKHHLNNLLHTNFSSTRLDVLLMILHMAYRHCNTQAFVDDQIKFVNYLFDGNVLDVSYYIYQKVFQSSASLLRHYFCPSCEVSVGSQKDIPEGAKFVKCPKCQKNVDVCSVDSGNYFITISLKEQVECILSRSDTVLIDKEGRENIDGLHDIVDGSIYKCCSRPECPFADKNSLTVTFNTDGVRLFEGSKNSLWPIQLHLNEITKEQRFKTENLIVGGLWFGRSAPNMALFLKPFLEELLELSVQGVNCPKPDGSIVKRPVFAVSTSLDAVAKCKVLFMKQYNGIFCCLYCLDPNTAVPAPEVSVEGGNQNDDRRKNLLRHYDTSQTYPLRTEDEVVRDMIEADTLSRAGKVGADNGSVKGFFGLSILLIFAKYLKNFSCNTFNIVWSVVIDYMHCTLEGVTFKLLNLFEGVLTTDQYKILCDRVKNMTPPHVMTNRFLSELTYLYFATPFLACW